MKSKKHDIPVLIMDLYSTGLSLIRIFSEKGIPVYGIDPDPKRIGHKSRYGIKHICPDPIRRGEDCLNFIMDMVDRAGRKMVALPTSDTFVLFLDRFREPLSNYLYMALPGYSIREKLVSKNGLFAFAEKAGMPVPETYFIAGTDDIDNLELVELRFPMIIKPNFSFDWHKGEVQRYTKGKKVIIVRSLKEIRKVYSNIALHSPLIILQEIIEGPDENLVYFVSYTDKNHEVIASFAGKKIRVTPIHFGSASYVETLVDESLNRICKKFLTHIRYWGLSGIEMKKDERDGKYKLIEINARYGLWDALGNKIGIDTAYSAYKDMLSMPVGEAQNTMEGLKWVKLSDDIRNFVRYRKDGGLSAKQYITTLRNVSMWDDLNFHDPFPTIHSMVNIPAGFLRSFARKILQ